MRTPPALPPRSNWRPLIERALAEDLGLGDLTGSLTIPARTEGEGRIEARQALVACGLPIATETFLQVDPEIVCVTATAEGESVQSESVLMRVSGPLRSILAAERVALNFLGRLCGVATWSRRFVAAVRESGALIVDTRKTVPGWRHLDKYATAVGGVRNHRMDLSDGVLIKDNHIAVCGGVKNAIEAARSTASRQVRIQVEVQTEEEAMAAIDAGADFLLLDNFQAQDVQKTVQRVGDRAVLEASGGLNLANIAEFAQTGVSRLSVGALTHSAPFADVALEIEEAGGRRR